jgi:hypothetical protein
LDEHAKRLEALRIVTTEITRDLGSPLSFKCSPLLQRGYIPSDNDETMIFSARRIKITIEPSNVDKGRVYACAGKTGKA